MRRYTRLAVLVSAVATAGYAFLVWAGEGDALDALTLMWVIVVAITWGLWWVGRAPR